MENPCETVVDSGALREMPEPKGLPVLGTIVDLIISGGAAKLHLYNDKRHAELGPIYRERIGSVKAVFINSPDEFRRVFRLEGPKPIHFLPEAWTLYNEIRKCKRGLFFMDGDEWLYFRRIANKLLLRPKSEEFMSRPCQNAADSLASRWEIYSENGKLIPELEAQLYQWSIEVMLATLMGRNKWEEYGPNIMRKSENLAKNLHRIFEYSATLSLIPAKLAMRIKLPIWKKFVGSIDEVMEIVRILVPEIIRLDGDGLTKMILDEGVQGEDLVRIVADLILAAGDTTAYSMQWALFLLASHPDVQERLYESIKSLDQDEIPKDPFLKGVIKESLRLYPTAPFLTRFLPEDNIIGGYRVAKGELLLLSLYSSGRNDANFPEANEFRPERWIRTSTGEYKGVINPHATLPFALGARSCVGRKLAEYQISLTLAKIVKTFRMDCTNKDSVEMILHLVPVPSEPIQLLLTKRSWP
uniref:Cytochrome P450-4 n=1 Tax=Cephus cinctus TaxID=211228 RepID=A0A1W6L1B8_CEPCN|nr:cytochrome P450-4 [Cephus cinctus]